MIKADPINLLKKYIHLIEDNEKKIYLVGPVKLPVTVNGETEIFHWYTWLEGNLPDNADELYAMIQGENQADIQISSVLTYGDFENSQDAIVRFHSICHTGDIFGSQKCDCGDQFSTTKRMIVEHGCGAIFYLANHEGRGIGLLNKTMAYILQENGYDTVEANQALGFKDDIRQYDEAIKVLTFLRNKPITLITNNPNKLNSLKQSGHLEEEQLKLQKLS